MNLAEWADTQHIHPQTAYRWHRQGKLPVPAPRVDGLIMVGDLANTGLQHSGKTLVYARVSSADKKPDLDRQVAQVTVWATSNGYSVDSVVTEVGSALKASEVSFFPFSGTQR